MYCFLRSKKQENMFSYVQSNDNYGIINNVFDF